MSMASEGQRVDQYYTRQPPSRASQATQSVLQSLKIAFDYLECKTCGRILETPKLREDTIHEWKFNLMELRPSILGVARGTCPVCQELNKQFSKVFRSV